MKRRIWAVWLIALHLAVAAVVIKRAEDIAVRVGLRPTPEVPGVAQAQALQAALDREIPSGAVVFLGDSITNGLVTAAVAAISVNYGIGYQRSDQLLAAMPAYASMARARAVVVTIGTNDLLQGRESDIGQRYRSILAKIPPGVAVVLSSVPPNGHHDARPLVEAARDACAADRRCTFVDAFAALTGVPGALQDDGVHLSPVGYEAWIRLLRGALPRG